MNRTLSAALGPEVMWALVFAIALFFAARNAPPTLAGNARLELVLWILPAAGVLCSFAPLLAAAGNGWWLLGRIAVSGAIGLYFVIERLCRAIDYGDSRNSGVGTAFMLALSLGLALLSCGVFIAAIAIFIKARFSHS